MVDRLTKRRLLAATAGGVATVAGSGASAADPWPAKPIRVLTPFGAGGSMDVLSRLLAPIVSEQLGQPVVVENRPGATGAVAMASVLSRQLRGLVLSHTARMPEFPDVPTFAEVGYAEVIRVANIRLE